jgi:glutathione S-transferase
MKLYITPASPYARLARIVVIEKGLSGAVEIIAAQTRTPDSPYYAVNPSGRVPYLVLKDGTGMEDSELICRYLDQLDGHPRLHPPLEQDNWTYGRIAMAARSMTDGIAVLGRELRRPVSDRSPTIVAHETARAERMADSFNDRIDHPVLTGPFNLTQALIVAGLDYGRVRKFLDLEASRPALRTWADRIRGIPSVAATVPT